MTNLMRAPSEGIAQKLEEKTLLTRQSWKLILALALVTLMSAVSAFAAPGRQIANEGLFRPRGMVRATVPLPGGGEVTDYWSSDGASGFCRIDQQPDPKNPGLTHGVLNTSTCYLPGVFEPMDYQAETRGVNGSNGYVFVSGINTVTRIEFIAVGGKTLINQNTLVTIFDGANSVFTNGLPVGRNRAVTSNKLGPDGKLYICFQGSGDIWRIKNPLSPTFTPAGNAVERVGTSDNGKTLLSMAWIGHDLWMAQAGFLNRIQNADLCHYTANCIAILEFGKLQTQEGMATDQYISSIPNGRWLYWGNGNRVVRYDTLSADIMQVWNQSGFVNGSVVPQEYSLIMGLNFVQPQHPTPGDPKQDLFTLADGSQVADMTVTTDPIIEAPPPAVPGPIVRTGRTWLYKATSTLVEEPCIQTGPNPPPCVTSQIGNDNPPNPSPTTVAARRAVLLLAGVTHARGLLWLNNSWWVSDEAQGFCRINQTGAAAAMTNCFQPVPGFIPGQAAADAPSPTGTQNVYIPDAGGPARGIYRMVFTPSPTGGTLSQTGLLNAGPGTAAVAAIPNGPFNDGAVYVGYYDRGKIDKIGAPATAPTAFIPVAGLAKGVGVLSMSFMGNDLYMAELAPPANTAGQLVTGGQITVLQAASPDLLRGTARVVTKPISRLQSPTLNTTPQLFINPAAIVVGPAGDRPSCLPPLGVALSPRVPKDPGTTPSLYFGSVGVNPADFSTPRSTPPQDPEVDQFDSICNNELPWVVQGALDPLLSLNVPLGPITALGIDSYTDPNAHLAIADDPGTVVQPLTLQKSQIRPPATTQIGQGHVYVIP